MPGMTWNQKLRAMRALDRFASPTMMPDCEQWVFSCGELADGALLATAVAWGPTPESVVEQVWEKLTVLTPPVTHIYCKGERVKWNGFMWEKFEVPSG